MNEKLLAQKENLLVLDEWTALFSSPIETIMIDGSENCSNFLLYKVVKCNLKPKKKQIKIFILAGSLARLFIFQNQKPSLTVPTLKLSDNPDHI